MSAMMEAALAGDLDRARKVHYRSSAPLGDPWFLGIPRPKAPGAKARAFGSGFGAKNPNPGEGWALAIGLRIGRIPRPRAKDWAAGELERVGLVV